MLPKLNKFNYVYKADQFSLECVVGGNIIKDVTQSKARTSEGGGKEVKIHKIVNIKKEV